MPAAVITPPVTPSACSVPPRRPSRRDSSRMRADRKTLYGAECDRPLESITEPYRRT